MEKICVIIPCYNEASRIRLDVFRDFLREQGDTAPLLLLDDIFDKLDAERVKQIIRLVSSDHFGQIFITDTNRQYLDEIIQSIGSQYSIFSVNRGEFEVLEGKLP